MSNFRCVIGHFTNIAESIRGRRVKTLIMFAFISSDLPGHCHNRSDNHDG